MLDPEREVYCFLNLGTEAKPKAGRGSNYWRAWVIANGEQPRKRQVLSGRVFVGKIFQVLIGDVEKRMDGAEQSELEKYSVIQEIKARRWP
jgi:negative regulator of replication initiation